MRFAEWVQTQRLSPATLASYRKNIRLHIDPHLGAQPIARLTGPMVDAWMRQLEAYGRADGRSGLSARTVRYVFTIPRSAVGDAVREGRLAVNPTDRSTAPSPSEARPPEMQAWTAPELARFLRWADVQDPDRAMGWRLPAATGMRRGEALALRWRDDCDAGRLAGPPQRRCGDDQVGRRATGRGPDQDGAVSGGRPGRGDRRRAPCPLGGSWTAGLGPVRDSALVLSDLDGTHQHPERFSRRFAGQVTRARTALGEEQPLAIRLHDLRQTHATLRKVRDCTGSGSSAQSWLEALSEFERVGAITVRSPAIETLRRRGPLSDEETRVKLIHGVESLVRAVEAGRRGQP